MPPAVSSIASRLAGTDVAGRSIWSRIAPAAISHAAALAIMLWTEHGVVAMLAFALVWALVNFFWLALLRRPATAAVLSLAMLIGGILISEFKRGVLLMTATFIDVMIVDSDTIAFLMTVFPTLARTLGIIAILAVPVLIVLWRIDPFRVRFLTALAGIVATFTCLAALSFAFPSSQNDEFWAANYVSKFARSGATATIDLVTRGYLESDATTLDRLDLVAGSICRPAAKPANIILLHDESSFDIRAAQGIKVPPGYGAHFRSFDGKQRSFIVEAAGGPSWYTEYNVLTGLSARSYGRFSHFLTRIAAGHVERGLPHTLRKCGYKTFTLYPFLGAFLGARKFQTTTGVHSFRDANDMGMRDIEPDSFYFDAAAKLIGKEKGASPLFLFVYTAANHFPFDYRYRPDLMPEWSAPGNGFDVDEYLRRQALSAHDFPQFIERLKREFPGEQFLIVRFGDHQPGFARDLIDRSLDQQAVSQRLAQFDPRWFSTYYAIDAINFSPVDLASALDTLDAPYLPLVVLEAAGLPLDASFAEQKKIFRRCGGMFYRCHDGAEARRFNRLLINAGLIKGL